MENSILKALPETIHVRLAPHLTRLHAHQEEVLYQPGEPARFIYFPCGTQISIIVVTTEGETAEGGVVGFEGVAGLPALLSDGESPHACVIQVSGDMMRLPADVARAEFRSGGPFQDLVLRYLQYLLVQIAQTALCNRSHPIEKRLARWMLLVGDAVGSNHFHLTHEFLATMLGANRPGVSQAASCLQVSGLISYHRGDITILDRARLSHFACDCYGVVRSERDRLLSQASHPAS